MEATADESVVLAQFPRRNRETGAEEQLRVTSGDFNGRVVTSIRIWYQGKSSGPGDDGWRPSKAGVSVREHEIDTAIAALEEARKLVHAEGRKTGGSPKPRPDREPAHGYGGSRWRRPHEKGVSEPTQFLNNAPGKSTFSELDDEFDLPSC